MGPQPVESGRYDRERRTGTAAWKIWTPRIAVIAYAAFLTVLALDSFTQHAPWTALFMHLLPTGVLIGFLWTAWRRPNLGGWLVLFTGGVYGILSLARVPWLKVVILALPLLAAGVLFVGQEAMDWPRRMREMLLAGGIYAILFLDVKALAWLEEGGEGVMAAVGVLGGSLLGFGILILREGRRRLRSAAPASKR